MPKRTPSTLGFAVTGLAVCLVAHPAAATWCSDEAALLGDALVACDAADNPVYVDQYGWGIDDSGEIGFGQGFGSWDFGGSSQRAIEASGESLLDVNGVSWRIATSTTGLAHNFFAQPMEPGETLRVRWFTPDFGAAGARIGISLHAGLTCQGALFALEREELGCGGLGCVTYTRLTDATRDDDDVAFGAPLGAQVEFTLTSATTYELASGPLGLPLTALPGGGTLPDVPIRGVCLRVQAGAFQRTAYFNQIQVIQAPEPVATLAGAIGAAAVAGLRRRPRRC